ncbi:MAG TPA: thiamine biosynthesis protein ThiS [Lachnospiraceae bacterium]|nr:thiamine biosynthesis protein ThiS [Lachnospiraceae bacterium]
MARINGKNIEISQNITVLQYIEQQELNLSVIAVEYNGNILPKSQYGEKVIKSCDVIEIVNFVGGG